MEDILNDDYGRLEQVLIETVQQVATTRTFNLMGFVQQMENEFIRLGFREKSVSGGVEVIFIFRFDGVGDFILTTSSIREIRMNYPFSYITLIVSKRIYPVAELCPYVNEVLAFDLDFNVHDIFAVILHAMEFSRKYLWKHHCDLSFYFGGDGGPFSTSLVPYICGAKERVSYLENSLCQILNTHNVSWNPREIQHDTIRNIYILHNFGLRVRNTGIEVWYNKNDLYKAKRFLDGFAINRIKIITAIGANFKRRCYPVEKYLVAFREIISKGASIIILGGPSEVVSARFLEENLPKEFVKNLVDVKTGWRVDAAIMSLADMYIGNFTGACDMAAALKKPIIALSVGAEDVEKRFPGQPANLYYPWQTNAIILNPKYPLGDCKKHLSCISEKPHCITQIEPSEIVTAFDEMVHFMKHSGIKKIDCPPIIRNIDQMSQLKANFEFKNVRRV